MKMILVVVVVVIVLVTVMMVVVLLMVVVMMNHVTKLCLLAIQITFWKLKTKTVPTNGTTHLIIIKAADSL